MKFTVTPEDVVAIHRLLSSRVFLRLYRALRSEGRMNVSALARKAGCINRRAAALLRILAGMGVVEERFRSGLHIFKIKDGELAELLKRTVEIIDSEG